MQTLTSLSAQGAFDDALQGYHIVRDQDFNTSNMLTEMSDVEVSINELGRICHEAAAARGWWHSLAFATPMPKERNVGELIALMHSELSEALEAARKDLLSDHIPEFFGVEEELADCLIRIFDFAGAANLRLGEAFVAKMKYNHTRKDHSLEARAAEGGKKI